MGILIELDYSDTFSTVAKMTLFDSFSPLQPFDIGLYISLTLKMHLYLVILKRKDIWSNHLDLLLRGSHLLWFVGYTSLFMVLNSILELGLADSVQ
jgi:hypothetical protein